MPDKGKRRPPWTEQPVGGPRCETHSSANRRFQPIPRPSISTHRARPLASGQLGCAHLPASLAAMPAGMRGTLWFSWGLHWRCIMRFTYSSGTSSCLVLVWSRDDPRRPWRRSRTWPASGGHRGRLAANVPAGLAATLTPSRTDRRRVDRSLMGCSEVLEHSLPGSGTPKLPPKPVEFNSKARLQLGGGHNTHAALSPFSCSDNRESSLLSLPRDPVKLYLAMCNFVFGHEARGGPVTS